jgi:hypothetical protein
LKLRRWSLGLRRWTSDHTRQGEPGEEKEFRFKIFEFRLFRRLGLQSPIENRHSKI